MVRPLTTGDIEFAIRKTLKESGFQENVMHMTSVANRLLFIALLFLFVSTLLWADGESPCLFQGRRPHRSQTRLAVHRMTSPLAEHTSRSTMG